MNQITMDDYMSGAPSGDGIEDLVRKAMAAGAKGEKLTVPRIMRLFKIGFRSAENVFSLLLRSGRVSEDGHYIPEECPHDSY